MSSNENDTDYVVAIYTERALLNNEKEYVKIWALPYELINVNSIDDIRMLSKNWSLDQKLEFVAFINFYADKVKISIDNIVDITDINDEKTALHINPLFAFLKECKLNALVLDIETLKLNKSLLPIYSKNKQSIAKTYKI